MTVEQLYEFFERHEDEYLNSKERGEMKHSRPDMHVFLTLDEIAPGTGDMITWAGHEEIVLDTSVEEVAAKATTEQLLSMIRCGLRLGDDGEYFIMFA